MAKYLAKRLAQSLIAILGITVVVFVILHLTGNPVELMVSPTTSREQMDILRQEMGFNDPLPQQYLRFLKGAVVGDFGTSYYYNEPAMRVVMERVPATLELAKIVLMEASLSFLGYGVPVTIPTWGRMLSEARANMVSNPWQCILPGLCITLTVLGVNLLGDWLRDYLDPKLDV